MTSHFPDGMPPVAPATLAQVVRRLPGRGTILVRPGSRVEPDDQIAQASAAAAPVLIDVAGALEIEPRAVPRRVRKRVGEPIGAQEVLARRGSRRLLAPVSGVISAIDAELGIVVITPEPTQTTLTAAVRGYVVAVEPDRSVTIETPAAVIQGVFGMGGEQFGVLRLLVTDRHDLITPELIDARSAYALIIGGAGITAEALRKAQQEQVRGVIVGGIEPDELRAFLGATLTDDWYAYGHDPALAAVTPTLLVTEGFGVHPMAEPLFELLTRYDRQEALLEGHTTLWPAPRRPRLVIPLPRLPGGQQSQSAPELRVGAIVRCVDEAHLGAIGRVTALAAQGRLPYGVRAATATVRIGEHEQIVLPQTGLEVISS